MGARATPPIRDREISRGKAWRRIPSLPRHAHNPKAWLLFQSCCLAVLNLGTSSRRRRLRAAAPQDGVSAPTGAAPPHHPHPHPSPARSAALPSPILYFHFTCDIPASESSHRELGVLGGTFDVGGREAAGRAALAGSRGLCTHVPASLVHDLVLQLRFGYKTLFLA